MIGFSWIQFRTQAVVGIAGLVVLAIVLGVTGPHLVHLFHTTVSPCRRYGDCGDATTAFLHTDRALQIGLDALVVIVPGLVGLFWGPPLVARELETGTFRLAWTQGVTRTRWATTKLVLVGAASMVVAGLASLMVTWWSSPVDRANMAPFVSFDQRDIVPIGYAAFAFALGALIGTVLRRTLPALATTLVVFVTVRLSFNHWLLPSLIAPTTESLPLKGSGMGFGSINGGPVTLQPSPPDIPNAWITSVDIVDRAGQPISSGALSKLCPRLRLGPPSVSITRNHGVRVAPFSTLQDCVAKLSANYHEVVTYQPGSHYWPLQWSVFGVYLVGAALLTSLAVLWVRRSRA